MLTLALMLPPPCCNCCSVAAIVGSKNRGATKFATRLLLQVIFGRAMGGTMNMMDSAVCMRRVMGRARAPALGSRDGYLNTP